MNPAYEKFYFQLKFFLKDFRIKKHELLSSDVSVAHETERNEVNSIEIHFSFMGEFILSKARAKNELRQDVEA